MQSPSPRRSCSTTFPATSSLTGTMKCDAKATDIAFAEAARIVTLELVNNRVVVNSMEPRNAIADYDPATARSTLYTATQGPHFVRDPLAEVVLQIPKDMLRLITPNVGGGFGMKAFVYPEQALVVWASRKLARPVKWQEERSEGFVSDNQGRDHTTRAELALDGNGRFLGLRVSILANLGAYLSPFGCFVPTCSTDLVSGLYAIGAIHINVKGVCTNTVPVCAYRGAGRPEAAYLLERLVDVAARELGMGPDAIRRINFVPPSAMPYTSATKLVLDSGEFEKVMDRCMDAAECRPSRSGGRKASATASCAASAWQHIPNDAAAAFRRPPRSSSRTTASNSSWATRNTAPVSSPLTSSLYRTSSASMPIASTSSWATPIAHRLDLQEARAR